MSVRQESVEKVLNELLDKKLITQTEYDSTINIYSSGDGLTLTLRDQYGQTNTKKLNACLLESGIDITMLFSMLDSTDDIITRHQKLNEAILSNIRLENSKISDRILKAEKVIKNQNRSIHYEAFRDLSGFLLPPETEYTYRPAYFDKHMEAIKLNYISSTNALIAKSGARMGKIEIIRQHSSAMSTLKNNSTSIENSIDPDISSYWAECIQVDSPIEIPYDTAISNVNRGAICELLVTLDFLSEINEITLTPFCEFPMEVVEISYSNSDDAPYSSFTPLVFKPGELKPENEYLINKISTRIMNYQFANIKAKRIKILLNQVNYAPNNFITKSDNLKMNGIFITEDKNAILQELLGPIEKAILNETFTIPVEKQQLQSNKLEYEYGLYNILITNNEYVKVSEYISTPFTLYNGSTVVLETDEEHYKNNDIQATSIEYELITEEGTRPIAIAGSTEIKWELMNPVHLQSENKIITTLRFPADISLPENIKIYKDEVELITGYLVRNDTEIELTEFDAYANYCITYKLKDPETATKYKLKSTQDVQLRAVLKRNSRHYTGVTPILYDYSIITIDMPLGIGEENELDRLFFVPDEMWIGKDYIVPIILSDEPVLISISLSHTEPIEMELSDILDIDEYDFEEE